MEGRKSGNMKKTFCLLVVLVMVLLAGCGARQALLSGEEREAVLAYSEPKTDNLTAGMNANDYAVFSKDFDSQMLEAMDQPRFESFKKDRDGKLGAYVSRQVNSVINQGEFISVIYDTVFEKDDKVVMRVVFRAAEPHQISGLWFDK
jgi:hypothetical protein